MSNKALVILGSQWGDEGKGKVVDLLAEKVDIVCRTGGGSNAGTLGAVTKERLKRMLKIPSIFV